MIACWRDPGPNLLLSIFLPQVDLFLAGHCRWTTVTSSRIGPIVVSPSARIERGASAGYQLELWSRQDVLTKMEH
jgi:hypothetical protein